MATLYLDPSGNGTPWDTYGNGNPKWSGDYTDLDEGTRATATPDSDEMYASSDGDQATITFTVPASGTPSTYKLYTWNDQGVPAYELRLNGTGKGNKTSADGNSGSWYRYDWSDTTAFSSLSEIAVVITCGSDEDDAVEAIYLEVTYEPDSLGIQHNPSSIIFPPGAGGIR